MLQVLPTCFCPPGCYHTCCGLWWWTFTFSGSLSCALSSQAALNWPGMCLIAGWDHSIGPVISSGGLMTLVWTQAWTHLPIPCLPCVSPQCRDMLAPVTVPRGFETSAGVGLSLAGKGLQFSSWLLQLWGLLAFPFGGRIWCGNWVMDAP